MTNIEKMDFVQKCHDAVIDDICESQFGDWDNPVAPHTSQIINDFKSEAAEYGYMDEREFDELYSECDRIYFADAMACC